MPKARDFTNRIIPLFVIVMIGWVLVIIEFAPTAFASRPDDGPSIPCSMGEKPWSEWA